MTSSSAADRSTPVATFATPQAAKVTKPHGDLGCRDGYKLISTEQPTIYCECVLGAAAYAMDQDPLSSYKAERWEALCRRRRERSGGDAA